MSPQINVLIFLCSPLLIFGKFDEGVKRSLIFPPGIGNKIQFLTGFGIPVSDLPEPYSITHGYVIKTNFEIFNNVSVFHAPYIEYQKRSITPSRWQMYELFQDTISSFGYDGRECVLRLICEAASTYFVKNSLVSEILHILLTPSLTSKSDPASAQDEDFHKAELLGKTNSIPCSEEYKNCKLNFLNFISTVRKTKHFVHNM